LISKKETEAQAYLLNVREQTTLVVAKAQTCCVTHLNEPQWFSQVKRKCFCFC